MSESVLLHDTSNGVRLLRINRPEKLNSVTPELSYALAEAMESAMCDPVVKVVGLTGQGRAFCAGADLGGAKSSGYGEDKLDDFGVAGRLVFAARVTGDKPIITGVNGLAMGVGVALAMLGDIRMAAASATFTPGYARVATSPDGGLSWTLPQAIGHEKAMRFLLEGNSISAQEALQLGMVGEVVTDDKFEERFLEYCCLIAKNSMYALRQTKRLIVKSELTHDIGSQIRDEMRYNDRGLRSDDGRAAVKKFFKP